MVTSEDLGLCLWCSSLSECVGVSHLGPLDTTAELHMQSLIFDLVGSQERSCWAQSHPENSQGTPRPRLDKTEQPSTWPGINSPVPTSLAEV